LSNFISMPQINEPEETSQQANTDTGLGTHAGRIGGRFINKDGSFNLRKEGLPLAKRASVYSYLLDLSWPRFLLLIIFFYLLLNLLFTCLYLAVGLEQLQGFVNQHFWGKVREVYYFSTQTFTTVGYGRINPIGDGADIVAAFETLTGWMFFAFVTGLLYGRFTRPKAYITFSKNILISPYENGLGLMFRMATYKTRHHLTDASVGVNLAVLEGEKREFKFYQLKLERSRIDMFNMNWTVVHPIDESSPLWKLSKKDMKNGDLEIYVQVSGFDGIYSNIVMQRTSYTYNEIVWGGKFRAMYHESADGSSTVLDLHRLSDYEKVDVDFPPA
jgi:inward rectifier potassium channel